MTYSPILNFVGYLKAYLRLPRFFKVFRGSLSYLGYQNSLKGYLRLKLLRL